MKREILFRGKRIDNGEWIYGDLTRYSEEMSYITVDLIENEVRQVKTDTVGQYTGLQDCKGIKIFEGDIVTVNDSYNPLQFTGYVEFKDASFCIIEREIASHYRWIDYECTVVGNIHDISEAQP